MSPGGHLVTTVAVCAASAIATDNWPLTLGLAAGGFCIDVDHAIDYVVVERQRDLRPSTFLRYYLEGRTRRAVLALHSWELFAVLITLGLMTGNPWLLGYVGGGIMHLALDVAFNGEFTPHSIVLFYSFVYRAAHAFDADRLLETRARTVSENFWRAFLTGAEAPRSGPTSASAPPEPSTYSSLRK